MVLLLILVSKLWVTLHHADRTFDINMFLVEISSKILFLILHSKS